jgi:hypothetical protein
MPLQFHFSSEAERWANLSYTLATTVPPLVKNIMQTSELKASQPMTTTISHILFASTNRVTPLAPASKRFNNMTSSALHAMTEAASQIFR